jgi:outer membrane protein TolC
MLKKLSITALMLGLMSITPSLTLAAPPPNRCPRIHAAVEALEAAKQELQEAKHDFCGNRKNALRDTDAALRQLRAAEACNACKGDRDKD